MKKTLCLLLALCLLACAWAFPAYAEEKKAPAETADASETEAPPPSPVPVENGDVLIKPDYEGPCEVEIIADVETNCYVYFEYIGESEKSTTERVLAEDAEEPYESDLAFYVEAGRKVVKNIPVGMYRFHYAFGTVFYGTEELFGDETYCFSADDPIDVYTNKDHYPIRYTSKFYKPDYRTASPREDFPTGRREP